MNLKDYELDEDGDTEMRFEEIEESEAEIIAWLSRLKAEIEEHTIKYINEMEGDIMDVENNDYGDNTLDDNDTNENNPESMTTSSYEEWVVKELDSFTVGAVTNLKVGLVDTKNYESGTWFVNRWISPQADQSQN